MKTVGEILRQKRSELNQDLGELARRLKVRKEYLFALEEDDYQAIPGGAPIITGILVNYSLILDLDPVKMRAIFRRDYIAGPKSILPPAQLAKRGFVWTPAYTASLIALVLVILVGTFYYSRSFFLGGPPIINLDSPAEGELVVGSKALVKGKIKRGDVISINGEKVVLAEDGSFEIMVECRLGENLLLIEAANPKGEEEQLTRSFVCQEE
jgi:hypothetical protein